MKAMSEPGGAEGTPFSRFQSLAKRLVSVPKAEADKLKAAEIKKPRKTRAAG